MNFNWNRIEFNEGESAFLDPYYFELLRFFSSLKHRQVSSLVSNEESKKLLRSNLATLLLNAKDQAARGNSVVLEHDQDLANVQRYFSLNWVKLSMILTALSDMKLIIIQRGPDNRRFEYRLCNIAEVLERASIAAIEQLSNKENIEENDELDLGHSVILNIHTWSDHPEINALINRIYTTDFKTGNEKIRNAHLKVILLHLYVIWKLDPTLKTAFRRDVDAYKAASRYNKLHISRTSIDVVDRLLETDWIEEKKGFFDHRKGSGKVTRIWPSERLLAEFREAKFGLKDIDVHCQQECIILRDDEEILIATDGPDGTKFKSKRSNIEYVDSAKTKKMRKQLMDYNELLSQTFIDIPSLEEPVIRINPNGPDQPKFLYVTQSNKFVCRIFNRNSWNKGGRFYGGWWVLCPKEYRKQIFINDSPTNEIDYSGLHIVLLYARMGVDYWSKVGTDPYAITPPDFLTDKIRAREIAKAMLLVALNAKNDLAAIKAFRNKAKDGTEEKKFSDEQLTTILGALRTKHPLIAADFASDAGIDLMNIDSKITALIIQQFVAKGIPILSVHDSYIVPYGEEDNLEDSMRSAFAQITGVKNVKMKEADKRFSKRLSFFESLKWGFGNRNEVFLAKEHANEPFSTTRSKGYQKRLNEFRMQEEQLAMQTSSSIS